MALNCTPEKLREEIEAGARLRDKHLDRIDLIDRMLAGSYYRSDRLPPRAVVVNFFYEFMSSMVPQIAHNNPRVRITSSNPDLPDAYGTTTAGQRAKAIGAALNQWTINDNLGRLFVEAAVDYFTCWTVMLTTIEDHHGYRGASNAPYKPVVLKLAPEHFFMDAAAQDADPTRMNGPRLIGHMWKTDRESLLAHPEIYNSNVVDEITLNTDVEKYDPERHRGFDIPMRDEIVCWDVWVPEKDIRMEADYAGEIDPADPAYNGTMYTLAANATTAGIGKKSYYLRDPYPAFVPPWGPYALCGYMKVRRSPYPLSPLVAIAEQAEAANAHEVAAADDARMHKKGVAFQNDNPNDGVRIKQFRNGGVFGLDDVSKIQPVELGGVSDAQYRFNDHAQTNLRRTAGVSNSWSGQPDKSTTATSESIAQSGFQGRTEGMRNAYHEGILTCYRTAAWYAHYGHGFQMNTGKEGQKIGMAMYRGGLLPGMEEFDFFDMALAIDAFSMEYTDQSLLQKRVSTVFEMLLKAAPIMAQTPWIRWSQPIRQLLDVVNVGSADEWLNEQALEMVQARVLGPMPQEQEEPQEPTLTGTTEPEPQPIQQSATPTGAGVLAGILPDPTPMAGMDAMGMAAEQGAMAGAGAAR